MRLRALAALTLAAPLLLTACGSDEGSSAADASSSASPSASASASSEAEPSGSAPVAEGDPAFCEAARTFSESSALDALAGGAPPEEVEAALTSAVEQSQALVETAPDEARPAFEELASTVTELRDVYAEAGFVPAQVDQERASAIRPDVTPEEQQAVDDAVAGCGLS